MGATEGVPALVLSVTPGCEPTHCIFFISELPFT